MYAVRTERVCQRRKQDASVFGRIERRRRGIVRWLRNAAPGLPLPQVSDSKLCSRFVIAGDPTDDEEGNREPEPGVRTLMSASNPLSRQRARFTRPTGRSTIQRLGTTTKLLALDRAGFPADDSSQASHSSQLGRLVIIARLGSGACSHPWRRDAHL